MGPVRSLGARCHRQNRPSGNLHFFFNSPPRTRQTDGKFLPNDIPGRTAPGTFAVTDGFDSTSSVHWYTLKDTDCDSRA
jgi:hypothetical protein